jgi:hypothetical protein
LCSILFYYVTWDYLYGFKKHHIYPRQIISNDINFTEIARGEISFRGGARFATLLLEDLYDAGRIPERITIPRSTLVYHQKVDASKRVAAMKDTIVYGQFLINII